MDQLAAKGGIPILTTKTNRQEQSKSGDRSTSTATPRQKKMTPRDTGAKKSRVIEVNDVHGSTLTSSQSTSSTIQDHASSIDSSTEAINGYCEK